MQSDIKFVMFILRSAGFHTWGTPKWMVYSRKSHYLKWMIRGCPYFRKTPKPCFTASLTQKKHRRSLESRRSLVRTSKCLWIMRRWHAYKAEPTSADLWFDLAKMVMFMIGKWWKLVVIVIEVGKIVVEVRENCDSIRDFRRLKGMFWYSYRSYLGVEVAKTWVEPCEVTPL